MAADIAVLGAADTGGDPFAAVVAASTRVLAPLRGGQVIAGDPKVLGAVAGRV